MPVLPMLIMPGSKGQSLRALTAGRKQRLEPRVIPSGPNAGKAVLPSVVCYDPAHREFAADFNAMQLEWVDTDKVFPEEPV
jgi:hypothetical protein